MHMLQDANILVTGGAGTLGKAILKRRKKEGWTGQITVYSTDEHKHALLRGIYPDVNFVCGDIRNPVTLYNAMIGHDIVIHAAAVKVIPASEQWSIDTFDVNVNGSLNVCDCAIKAHIKHVLGISTDKACHPANAYGATKLLMEKTFQEYARLAMPTAFHLVRYGNVLESTGSVIETWKRAVENGEKIKITNPNMTRFYISPSKAVDYVVDALLFGNGYIYIPKMRSLSIDKLVAYAIGNDLHPEFIPIRPGEKMHETLLTVEEGMYALENALSYLLRSAVDWKERQTALPAYSSDIAEEMTKEQLMELLADGQK